MARIPDADGARLTRCAVVFESADPPRAASMAFWSIDPESLPDGVGRPGELSVVLPAGTDVRRRSVPAIRLPIAEALPLLTRARNDPDAHPAAALWGAASLVALQLVARGRMVPGLSTGDFDAWRVGPLDAPDVERIRALAAAMPAQARAVPVEETSPIELHDAELLVRGFLDAVADGMPRTAAAAQLTGGTLFASPQPQRVPRLRMWADEIATGVDAGVRISLRVDVPDGDFKHGAFRAVVQVHSASDPALMTDAAELWRGYRGFGPRAQLDTIVAVRRAVRIWPLLDRLLQAKVPDQVMLADDDVIELLSEIGPLLATAGIDVHWPKGMTRQLTAKAVVGKRESPPSDVPAFFGGNSVLSFDWQLALGDDLLTEEEMDRLAEAHRPIVRLRDQWLLLDPALAQKAKDRKLKPVTAIEALSAALTGTAYVDGSQVDVAANAWLDGLRHRIKDPDAGAELIDAPKALAGTLRDYQLRGLRWLDRMTSLGLGACLADDMGLGKTIMLISLHLHQRTTGGQPKPTLVVCPASLLGNWEREIQRFAPGVTVRRFHGTGRTVERIEDGFVLTTYGTMRLDTDRLAQVGWGLVVADEAQHVKNSTSSTARALRRIGADSRIALTGTPVENNLSELWAILDWTTPGLLGTLRSFRNRWAKPIESGADNGASAERLAALVRPFLLRRKKSDPGIAPELPPKTETDMPVELTQEQAALYEAAVREAMTEITGSAGILRRGLVVKLLTALKQICNHPAHYLKETEPLLSGRSGKLELLDELLDTIISEDGSVLVFTQYVAMARLLEQHLAERGVATQLLHGGTPVAKRDALVNSFQAGAVPVFLLSLKAAGTGLNLTRADHVIHFDRWWNPAVEDQATDRAYRIGQTRPVQVHRLIAEGTIEDRIAAMIESKKHLAESVLSAGDAALTELTDVELADLVTLRAVR